MKLLNKLQTFLYSDAYLILLGIFTLISWQFHLDQISFYLVFSALLLMFVFLKDATCTIPLLFSALFLLSDTQMDINTIPYYLYFAPVVFILGAIIHIIKNKQRLFQGKLLLSIIIMFVAMALSTFNSEIINLNLLFYSVIGVSYAFVYFTYRGSIQEDRRAYLLKTFFMLGLVVSLQIFLFYVAQDDVIYALEHKTLKLGWGISNYAATYLIIFIPATVYYLKHSTSKFLFTTLFTFQLIMLLFTLSRAGILAFLAILPLLILYLTLHENWKKSVGNFLLIASFFILIYFLNKETFDIILDRMISKGLDDTGRIDLWKEAWNHFLSHPLFGGGIFTRLTDTYRMYHNTFLHVLATMGLVGFVGLLLQIFLQFKIVIKNKSEISILFFIMLLGAHLHGLVDNIYLMPQFMILIMIIIAVFEQANSLKQKSSP